MESLELPDCQERSVCVDLAEELVLVVMLAVQAHQVLAALWATKDHQAVPAREEIEVETENRVQLVIQARTVPRVYQDLVARKEKLVKKERQVLVVWRDSQARKD